MPHAARMTMWTDEPESVKRAAAAPMNYFLRLYAARAYENGCSRWFATRREGRVTSTPIPRTRKPTASCGRLGGSIPSARRCSANRQDVHLRRNASRRLVPRNRGKHPANRTTRGAKAPNCTRPSASKLIIAFHGGIFSTSGRSLRYPATTAYFGSPLISSNRFSCSPFIS